MTGSWLPPTLQTPRLLLRPITEDDHASIFAYAKNPAVARYTLFNAHQSIGDTEDFVKQIARANYLQRILDPLGICIIEQPATVIGTAGVRWVSMANRTMDLGYVLAQEHWGKGYAVEACRALLDYAFTHYPVERIQASVFGPNVASVRVMEKLGATREGTMRRAVIKGGESFDLHLFSVLRSEWQSAVISASG
jgi:ribosomal-protein-alanine N-acetyltransferase